MKFPILTSFRLRSVFIFMVALFIVQQLEGTDIVFSFLTALYIFLFAIAFNVAGGMTYPSGAYIFFNGVLTAILGLVYKALLGQKGDSILLVPNLTMAAYCGGMAALGAAGYFCRRYRTTRGLIGDMVPIEQMKITAAGCLFLGFFLTFFSYLLPASLASALVQINRFSQMAIILAVYYEIQTSKGKRSFNWIVYVGCIGIFILGTLTYSKEGMFLPLILWLIPCILLGYRLTRAQVVMAVLFATYSVYYLVPFSQYARNFRNDQVSQTENFNNVAGYLLHPNETRDLYKSIEKDIDVGGLPHFFTGPQGLMDRLQMLAFDDALIAYTEDGHEFGLFPVYANFANLVPHALWAGKPDTGFGNLFGREIGVIDAEDITTGISFSPTGDAYHEAKWLGIVVVMPLIIFLLFFVTDSISGDVRKAPWGILSITVFAHIAPEGLLGSAIYMTVYGNIMVLIIVYLAKYVIPHFAVLLPGSAPVAAPRRVQLGTLRRRTTPL